MDQHTNGSGAEHISAQVAWALAKARQMLAEEELTPELRSKVEATKARLEKQEARWIAAGRLKEANES